MNGEHTGPVEARTEETNLDLHAIAMAAPMHPQGDFWAAPGFSVDRYDESPRHDNCACGKYCVATGFHWHVDGKCHSLEKCDE
jgi:hypothetical protein